MKILVIQQKMIGDVLTSTIICESLKKKHPESEIHYLINSNTIPVVQNNPYIDYIVEFTDVYRKNKLEFYSFLKTIKNKNYDWVIDVYGKIESNLITLFSGAKKKTSYKKWYTSFLYTDLIIRQNKKQTNSGLAIENRLRLVVDDDQIEKNDIRPQVFLTKKEIDKAKSHLEKAGVDFNIPIVMISVLGSGTNKTLPFEYMAKTIDNVVTTVKCTILYNYIPPQSDDAKKVLNFCADSTKSNTRFDVFGKSLREFLAILYHCKFLIGNEGGAVNMAKALQVPTFTIFSPWIEKEGWNLFESEQNVSVHLKDFLPELYTKPEKGYKKQVLEMYEEFTPNLYEVKLLDFLKKNR